MNTRRKLKGGIGTSEKRKAATKIAKIFKGQQTRKSIEKKNKLATKIQTNTRKSIAKKIRLNEERRLESYKREGTRNVDNFKKELTKGAPTYKKTLKNIDVEYGDYKNPPFSRKPLEKLNFTGVDFSGDKCTFVGSKINNSIFSKSNLEKCNFTNATANNVKFNYANMAFVKLEGTLPTGKTPAKIADFTGSSFKHADMRQISVNNNTILQNTDITGAIFSSFSTIDKFPFTKSDPIKHVRITKFPGYHFPIITEISDKTFIKLNVTNIVLLTSFTNIDFIDCNFDKLQFNQKSFNNCNFTNCTFNAVEFDRFLIQDCTFTNCKFTKVKFRSSPRIISSNFTNCNLMKIGLNETRLDQTVFTETNLTSATFNASDLRTTSFIKCKLNGIQCIPFGGNNGQIYPTLFSSETIFTESDLRASTFQNCSGLTNINFRGINLSHAVFTHLDLTDCNFANAVLNNTTFRRILFLNCNFTDSIRDEPIIFIDSLGLETNEGHTNIELGLDDAERIVIYPSDIHAAFNVANIKKLHTLLLEYVTQTEIEQNPIPNTNNGIIDFITRTMFHIIDKINIPEGADENLTKIITDEKTTKLDGFNQCLIHRIRSYDYVNLRPDIKIPDLTWFKLIYLILLYVKQQSINFQDSYYSEVIVESYTTYGVGGLSCIRGINERFAVKLRHTMLVMLQSGAITDNTKIIEYNKIIMALDPTLKLPETLEELENIAPDEEYFEMTVKDEIRTEWFNLHNASSDDPFNEDSDIDMVMNSYKDFLKIKFNYNDLTEGQKIIYDEKIEPEYALMRELLVDGGGLDYMFVGGGRRRRKINVFSLSSKEFTKLFNKVHNKLSKKTRRKKRSKNKKRLNTRKR